MIEAFETIVRFGVGALLITAGLAKWRLGPRAFAIAIQGYGVLPRSLPLPAAHAITVAEIGIGAILVSGLFLPAAALGAAGLLLLFASAMAVALFRGVATACGCSLLVKSERISWRLVSRNVAMAAMLAPLILGP